MIYFLLFTFGAVVGSFINVLTIRYRPENKIFDFKIIGGRSHCMSCQKKLAWFELIPIFSFIMQKGKCRKCGNKISWQYPLVEFLSGLIFVSVFWKFNFNHLILNSQLFFNYQFLIIAVWVLFFLGLLILSVIDFKFYIIPDSINLFLVFLGIILMILNYRNFSVFNSSYLGRYALFFDINYLKVFSNIFINHFFAFIVALVFIGLIIVISRGAAMGWGDFKLAGALSLIFGWPDIVLVLAFAFIIGSVAVLPLLIKKEKKMKDIVPFGPFLAVSSGVVFFFGFIIIDAYFRLFNLL